MVKKNQTPPEDYIYQILDLIPVSIYWKDAKGRYLGCNKYVMDMANINNRSDIIGKKDTELPWKNIAEKLINIDKYVMKHGQSETEETPIIGSQERLFSTVKAPLKFKGSDKAQGIIGISIDITDRKQAQELRFQHLLNQEKLETQRLLAASIAHEIRTPLAAINAQSGIIKSILPTLLEAYQYALESGAVKKPLRTSQFEFLTHIPEELNQTTASANTFIDMLLAKVNLENLKEQNMPLNQLSMKDTLMDAIHLYPLDSFSAAMIQCDYKKTFEFMGDEVLFRHIIFNLLKNAIYFVRSKGKGGSIKIWCEQQQDQNILHFKDTGIGVSPESLPNIFNSFYTNTRHGTGVGLAFCKMIIESFGGNISCESVQGEYTHFMLCFPKI